MRNNNDSFGAGQSNKNSRNFGQNNRRDGGGRGDKRGSNFRGQNHPGGSFGRGGGGRGGGSKHNDSKEPKQTSTFKKFKGTGRDPYLDRKGSDLNTHAKFYAQSDAFSLNANRSHRRFDDNICDTENQQENIEAAPQIEPARTPVVEKPAAETTPIKLDMAKSKTTKESSSSSSSSSSSDSEDSAVKALKKVIGQTLQSEKTPATVVSNIQKTTAKIKKEADSKSDKSSSATSSSSSSSSSEEDSVRPKQSSEEDVICLGNLEKFENLVDDDLADPAAITNCLLCDKSGHISFHCQMICKNCNGKYHSLKNCPKPANLSVVLSSFMQFCLKQSYKYNPNLGFSADGSEQIMSPMPNLGTGSAISTPNLSDCLANKKRKKSTRKHDSSSPSSSTESDSEGTSSYRKKHKKSNSSKSRQTAMQPFPSSAPFPAAFNPAFGFNQSGVVNPLLALSQMMGYSPVSMGFPANAAKD